MQTTKCILLSICLQSHCKPSNLTKLVTLQSAGENPGYKRQYVKSNTSVVYVFQSTLQINDLNIIGQ